MGRSSTSRPSAPASVRPASLEVVYGDRRLTARQLSGRFQKPRYRLLPDRRRRACMRAVLLHVRRRPRGWDIRSRCPTHRVLRSTITMSRSPALNWPSSHSASPSHLDRSSRRFRTCSMIIPRCSSRQLFSFSKYEAISCSMIGGSTVLSAANIQAIARARALGSGGRSPACRSARCRITAPDLKRVRSPSSYVGMLPNGLRARCSGSFSAFIDSGLPPEKWSSLK